MQETRVIVERGIPVVLRDGTRTWCDVYRPETSERVPAVLQRTPYDRTEPAVAYLALDPLRAACQGYAVVLQDVRGRYASEGTFDPFFQEIEDGYDSVEWCAEQAWCDGNVGMIGASYAGIDQLLAAIAQPPHLRCIVPMLASSDLYEGWTYQGGALMWGFMVAWVLPMLASEQATTPELVERLRAAVDDLRATWQARDASELPLVGELAPYLLEWAAHPTRDDYWRRVGIQERYADVGVPSLHVGGWYDIFADGTLRNFAALSGPDAPAGSRLIMGPWAHTVPTTTAVGAVDFGIASGQHPTRLAYDIEADYLRFLGRWLKRGPAPEEPPVRLFVMGRNAWRDESEWPLARARETALHLRSGGHANSAAGDGALTWDPPAQDPPDHFLYDPSDPVPTSGGNLCCYPTQLPPGPFDQTAVERRADVLVYVTEPLEQELEVTGPVTLELWASTSAADTDMTAKLVDVGPCGVVRNLADGILRGRHREGTDAARPLTPGEPVLWRIEVGATSNVFRAGHRIGLEVSSSNFPRFARNPNVLDGGDPVVAHQVVHHDPERPSRLLLPVVPANSDA